MKHLAVGEYGEEKAIQYLKGKKYKIIAHNYKNKIGEIDIIAKDSEYLVFVEVKTRSTSVYGAGYEAVTPYKQNKIRQVAQLYMMQKQLEDCLVRFDVVSITDGKLEHFINAF